MPMIEVKMGTKAEMPFRVPGVCDALPMGMRFVEMCAESKSKRHKAVLLGRQTVYFLHQSDTGSESYFPEHILHVPHGPTVTHMAVTEHQFATVDGQNRLSIWTFEDCIWKKEWVYHPGGTCASLEWNFEDLIYTTVLGQILAFSRRRLPLVGYRYWWPMELHAPVRYHIIPEQAVET